MEIWLILLGSWGLGGGPAMSCPSAEEPLTETACRLALTRTGDTAE